MPDNVAQQLFSDPDFRKLPPADQTHAFDAIMSKHDADYAKLTPPDRQLAFQHLSANFAPKPSFLQGLGQDVANAITPGASGVSLGKQELMPRPDPSGKGTPTPWYVNVPEDVGGGLAQIGGAAGGAAVGGPLGAIAGAGAGNVAANRLIGSINHHFYGHENNPTLGSDALAFGLGAGLEGVGAGANTLMERSGVKALKKAAASGGAAAVEDLATEDLPKAAATYREGAEKAAIAKRDTVANALAQAREKAIAKIAPQAAQDELGRLTNVTPAQAAAIDDMANGEFAMQRGLVRDALKEPEHAYGDSLSQRFEAIQAPHVAEPIASESVNNIDRGIANERDWLAGKTILKPVRDVMDALSPSTADPLSRQFSEQARKEMAPGEAAATRAVLADKLAPKVETAAPTEMAERDRARRAALGLEGDFAYPPTKLRGAKPGTFTLDQINNADVKQPTVGDLLAHKRTLDNVIKTTKDGVSATAASVVRDHINEALATHGLSVPRDLREEWGLYKAAFTPQYRHNIAESLQPTGYAQHVFGEPRRFKILWDHATPENRSAMRTLLGQWGLKAGPGKFDESVSDKALRSMFGDTSAAKMRYWANLDAKTENWSNVVKALPPESAAQVTKWAQESAAPVIADAVDKNNRAIGKMGGDLARSLGPAGRRIGAQIHAAATPEAKRRITEETFGKMFQDVPPQAPPATDKAGFDAYMNLKALSKDGLDVNAKREAGAMEALRAKARGGDPMAGMMKRRMAYLTPNTYGMIRAAATAVGAFVFEPRDMVIRSMDSPQAAAKFLEGLAAHPNSLNAKHYAGKIGESAAHWYLRQSLRAASKTAATAAQQNAGLGAGIPPEGEGE